MIPFAPASWTSESDTASEVQNHRQVCSSFSISDLYLPLFFSHYHLIISVSGASVPWAWFNRAFSLFQASAYRETGFIQQIDLALVQLFKTSPHRAVALHGNSGTIRLSAREPCEG